MKKILGSIILVFIISIISHAQTEGDLSVSVVTSDAGGIFAPRNCVVIWIEDDQGDFVKTLLSYADNYRTYLNIWEASTTAAESPFNTVDAITGASVNTHATRTCSWDGTDVSGSIVTDGSYTVCMELTDKNATGNHSSFPFTKGEDTDNQVPLNQPSFSTISIIWTASGSSVANIQNKDKLFIFPNPTKGMINIEGDKIQTVEIRSITGQLIYVGNKTRIDISNQPNGLYMIKIKSKKHSTTKKVMKY